MDTAKLQLEVDSSQVKKGTSALDDLTKSGTKAEKNTKKLSGAFKLFSGVLATLGTAKVASDFLDVNVQFEKLEANLRTVTGSAKVAEAEFKNIQELASTLPFQVSELTQAFISLRNFGLDASEEALVSFSNTAAASGKSLQQFIEAISDATTFEFERLKEFGIKTKQEGDKVQFTFRGITTEVQKSAFAVQGYLDALGRDQFQGAAAEQARGLAGAISNLGDEYDNLLKTIGDSGVSDTISSGLRRIARGLGIVSDAIVDTPQERLEEIEEKMSELAKTNIELFSSGKRITDSEKRLAKARQNHIGFLIEERNEINAKLDADREEVKLAKEKERVFSENARKDKERKDKLASDAKLKSELNVVSDTIGFDVDRAKREFEEREALIREAEQANLQLTQSFAELRKANARTLQEELTAIEKSGAEQRDQILTDEQSRTLGATGQFFGNLAAIAQAGGKDQFQAYKNLASAQAGISTALAVLSVLGDPLIPTLAKPAFATAIGALGAVQIAQIQSQDYQPRALGGQMKAGGSFLVGERGPELVTMGNRNANITPNNQLGSGAEPIQLTNVFQISTGVAETAQAEILRAVPFLEKLAVNAVNSAARKGGATSRIVGAR